MWKKSSAGDNINAGYTHSLNLQVYIYTSLGQALCVICVGGWELESTGHYIFDKGIEMITPKSTLFRKLSHFIIKFYWEKSGELLKRH